MNRAAADDEIEDYYENRFDVLARDVHLADETPQLLARVRWVNSVASSSVERLDEGVTLRIHSLDPMTSSHVVGFANRLIETWTDELGLEAKLESIPGASQGQTIHLKGIFAAHYAAVECGFHAVTTAGFPAPKLMLVQLAGEPVRDVIVRNVTVHESHQVKTFPSAEELRQSAWETIDRNKN